MKHYLDFEKTIFELERKLEEMKQLSVDSGMQVVEQVKELEQKIEKLKIETYKKLTRWQRVQLARHPERPYTLDYIYTLSDSFIELHGDRQFKDDTAIVGGFATVGAETLMIIGHQKGRDTEQRLWRNFGMANPEGYRKAQRLMKLAEKFNKPIITMIDTPGAYPGVEAEERGQAEAIAKSMFEMFQLKVPILAIVIGEGASGGAIGLGIGDKVFMLENTWYSVISPESCSSILWRDWAHKEQAAQALKLTAQDMLNNQLIDKIIPEPIGGAHKDAKAMANILKDHILKEIAELQKQTPEKRIAQRIERFSQIGKVMKNEK